MERLPNINSHDLRGNPSDHINAPYTLMNCNVMPRGSNSIHPRQPHHQHLNVEARSNYDLISLS